MARRCWPRAARAAARRRPRAARCRPAPRRRAPRRAWRRRARGLHRRMLVEHALDLDRRDVLAAAADHVLLAVDEVEVAFGVAPHHVAGVEPAVGPGLVGGFARPSGSRRRSRAADRRRRSAPAVRPARRRRRRAPFVVDEAHLDEVRRRARSSSCRRGAARGCAMTQAAAPVSVIAQASTSGKPKRSSNGAWFLRSTPAPKPQRIACSRSTLARRRREQHRRHHAEVVRRWSRRLSRTLCTSVFGWKRSSCTRQPPRRGSPHRRERHRVHVVERQRRDDALGVGRDARQTLAERRSTTRRRAGSSRWRGMQPLGRPVVPEV